MLQRNISLSHVRKAVTNSRTPGLSRAHDHRWYGHQNTECLLVGFIYSRGVRLNNYDKTLFIGHLASGVPSLQYLVHRKLALSRCHGEPSFNSEITETPKAPTVILPSAPIVSRPGGTSPWPWLSSTNVWVAPTSPLVAATNVILLSASSPVFTSNTRCSPPSSVNPKANILLLGGSVGGGGGG